MNDIFNLRRFGKYFLSDLTRLYSDNWLKVLCFGLIPVFATVLSLMFSLIGNYDYSYADIWARDTFWSISVVIFVIWLPAACFGYVTDKRAGGNFMLVPASTFEKTASMIINTAVVIPAAFIAIYMTSDFLCTIASGEEMQESLAVYISEGTLFGIEMQDITGQMLLSVHAGMLFFLLGAVFFRKGKISKSILVFFGQPLVADEFLIFFNDENMIRNGFFPRIRGVVCAIGYASVKIDIQGKYEHGSLRIYRRLYRSVIYLAARECGQI